MENENKLISYNKNISLLKRLYLHIKNMFLKRKNIHSKNSERKITLSNKEEKTENENAMSKSENKEQINKITAYSEKTDSNYIKENNTKQLVIALNDLECLEKILKKEIDLESITDEQIIRITKLCKERTEKNLSEIEKYKAKLKKYKI